MNRNGHRQGFTLVELIVVVGIISALAAVAVPSVAHFAEDGRLASNAEEMADMQDAIDMLIGDNRLSSVDPSGGPTGATAGDWASTDFGGGLTLYPQYVKRDTSKCDYEWDASGNITNQSNCG